MKISKDQAKQLIETSVGVLDRRMYNELGAYVALFFLTADNLVLAVSNKNAIVMDDSYLNSVYISSPITLRSAKKEAIERMDTFLDTQGSALTVEELINNATQYTYDHCYKLGESILLASEHGDVRVYSDGEVMTDVTTGAVAQFTDKAELEIAKQTALIWIARAVVIKNSVFKTIKFEDHVPLTEQPALIEVASMKISEILNAPKV